MKRDRKGRREENKKEAGKEDREPFVLYLV